MALIQSNMMEGVRKDMNSTSILQNFTKQISKEYTF